MKTLVFRVIFTFKDLFLLFYFASLCWVCVTCFALIASLCSFWFFFSVLCIIPLWVLHLCMFSWLILSSVASRSKVTSLSCSDWLVWWWWIPCFRLLQRCLVFPSCLKGGFSGYRVLGWKCDSFRGLNMASPSLLVCEASAEKSFINPEGLSWTWFAIFLLLCVEFSFLGLRQLHYNGPERGTICSFETPGSESVYLSQ